MAGTRGERPDWPGALVGRYIFVYAYSSSFVSPFYTVFVSFLRLRGFVIFSIGI